MNTCVERRKIGDQQAVSLSINIAPYLKAYQRYKALHDDPRPEQQLEKISAFYKYNAQRFVLEKSLSLYAAGDFSEIYDLAMSKSTQGQGEDGEIINYFKMEHKPAVYEALTDSFVELLKNSVDARIQAHVSNSNIPAALLVTMSVYFDESKQDTVSVKCVDNGTGFDTDFLDKVDTHEARNDYRRKVSSSKLVEAGTSPEIPLYFGGRGKGLSMLMRKIDVGIHNEPDHKYAKKNYKANVSDIVFSNAIDGTGHVVGAAITVTTSRMPVVIEEKNREPSPSSVAATLSLDMNFLDEDDEEDKHSDYGPSSR